MGSISWRRCLKFWNRSAISKRLWLHFELWYDLSPTNPRSNEKSLIQKLTEIRIICFNRSWWIQLQTVETCKCNLLGRKCRISATVGKLIFKHSFYESYLYCNYILALQRILLILEQDYYSSFTHVHNWHWIGHFVSIHSYKYVT